MHYSKQGQLQGPFYPVFFASQPWEVIEYKTLQFASCLGFSVFAFDTKKHAILLSTCKNAVEHMPLAHWLHWKNKVSDPGVGGPCRGAAWIL